MTMFTPPTLADVEEQERIGLGLLMDQRGQYPCQGCGAHRPAFALVDMRLFVDKKAEVPDFIGDCCWSDHQRHRRAITNENIPNEVEEPMEGEADDRLTKESKNFERRKAHRKNWDIHWQKGHGASASQINKIKASYRRG